MFKKKFVPFILMTLVILFSCDQVSFHKGKSEDRVSLNNYMNGSSANYADRQTFDIYAGQFYLAGTLTVWNDEVNLYVRYDITAQDTALDSVHLWFGTDPLLVLKNKSGIPVPGQFPRQAENIQDTTYEFVIPLETVMIDTDNWCNQTVIIYAHAALISTGEGGLGGETAWSHGTPFDGPRWGWYSEYTLTCVETETELLTDTVFVKFPKPEGRVFTTGFRANPEEYQSWELTKNRWGWGLETDGPGIYQGEIWAGAGLNHTEKGALLGTAVITIHQSGSVDIQLELGAEVSLSEVHIYAANEKPDTIAPGQYGFTRYYQPFLTGSAAYQFTLLPGTVYLIIHGVALYQL